MVDVQTVSIVIAAVAVVVAAVNIIIQNRKAEKTRQTELMMQLFSPFRDYEFIRHYFEILNREWKDFDDYMKKYGMQNYEEYSKELHVMSFFSSLGLFVRMGLIDLETVVRWHPEATLWLWEKMQPIAQEAYKRMTASGTWRMENKPYEWFEYLYDEMKKREQQPASRKE